MPRVASERRVSLLVLRVAGVRVGAELFLGLLVLAVDAREHERRLPRGRALAPPVCTGQSGGAILVDIERSADHFAFLGGVADEVWEWVVADVRQFGRGKAGGEQEQRRHREATPYT